MSQEFLNEIANKSYSSCMLNDIEGWCNHRPLMYIALELTKKSTAPILELGCGKGSTEQLHQYVNHDNRTLISFDTNENWLNTYKHLENNNHKLVYKTDEQTSEWLNEITNEGISVCLIDHAPGERRHSDIQSIYKKCDILVIHDSEPEATGYMLDKIWHLFKYRLDIKRNGAWATMVSNKYDFSKFNNTTLANQLFTV
jgi:hypothetical protein